MEKKDKTILTLSIITGIILLFMIFMVIRILSVSYTFNRNDNNLSIQEQWEEMDLYKERMFNRTNFIINNIWSGILSPIMLVLWIVLVRMLYLRIKEKNLNTIPWGLFAFFLAPIAGIIISLKK